MPTRNSASFGSEQNRRRAARDHGKDYHEAQTAADRLDHYAHQVRRLHDAEYKDGWRHESLSENS